MAPPTTQVIALLSQSFATSSMRTDDFDNPSSGGLTKMEVLLGSMLIYILFSLRSVTEENRDKTGQAECKRTLRTLSFLTV